MTVCQALLGAGNTFVLLTVSSGSYFRGIEERAE